MSPILAGLFLAALASSEPTPSPTPADIPRLIEQMKASPKAVDWSATSRFGAIGRPAVPALLEVLRDRTLPAWENVQPARCQAARALGAIGPAASEAVPTLLKILRDRRESEYLRRTAAGVLGGISLGNDGVVPALLDLFDEREAGHTELGFAAIGSLWRLAKERPAARPELVQALSALRRIHDRWGGSHAFAEMFQILEPPSPARRAEEDVIQEILIRKEIASDADTWCLRASVSDAAFERLKDLKVTRSMRECRAPRSEKPSAPNVITRLYQSLHVRGIDWLSKTRVYAETEACFGYIPCFITQYQMERRRGRWIIVSENTPPAL